MQTLSFQITSALLFGCLLGLPAFPNARAEAPVSEDDVFAAVDKVAPTVEEVALKLRNLAEVSLLESKSSAFLKELLKQVKADFDKRTKGFPYQSPIPDVIKEPSGLPDEKRPFGTRVQLKETILRSTGEHLHAHGHELDHDHGETPAP